jgi:hypothetical protein
MGEGRMEREEGKRKQERERERKGEINKLNILILI